MIPSAPDARGTVRLWQDALHMGIEAQFVIGMRLAGMMGLQPQRFDEGLRMVSEKSDAAAESIRAALRAASRGQRADQVLKAAMRPYGRRTHQNALRLGPKKR